MTAPREMIKRLKEVSLHESIANMGFVKEAANSTTALCEMLEVALEALEKIPSECSIWGGNIDAIKFSKEALTKINAIAGAK